MKTFVVLAAATGALASLNCTTTAPIKYYCCPNRESEVIKEVPVNYTIKLGCAADEISDGRWFWNYNGLYTPSTTAVKDCKLNNTPYNSTDVLPYCSVDTYVLELTEGKTSPLDECDAECVSNDNLPADTYFGDTQ